MKCYHVTKEWDGQDLESLYAIYGDEAYDIYAEKWPEAGELAQAHAHVVHLHASIDEAKGFAAEFGGEILEIDAPEDYEIEIDSLEYDHPVCRHEIEKNSIRRI